MTCSAYIDVSSRGFADIIDITPRLQEALRGSWLSAMALGTWQQVVLVDFDNRPRQRRIAVQAVGE